MVWEIEYKIISIIIPRNTGSFSFARSLIADGAVRDIFNTYHSYVSSSEVKEPEEVEGESK